MDGDQRFSGSPLVLLLSWLCVFRESTQPVGFLCFLFEWKSELSEFSFGQFPSIFFPLSSDSQFIFGFWVQSFCLSIILIESIVGYVFHPSRHHLDTKGPFRFDPFLWFVLCFDSFQACDPCPSGFAFWGNATRPKSANEEVLSCYAFTCIHTYTYFLRICYTAFDMHEVWRIWGLQKR